MSFCTSDGSKIVLMRPIAFKKLEILADTVYRFTLHMTVSIHGTCECADLLYNLTVCFLQHPLIH
jgi:hypothetical protein